MQQCYLSFLISSHHLLPLATVRLCSYIFPTCFFSQPLPNRTEFSILKHYLHFFCPSGVQFPSDCPEVLVQHTWRAIHAAVCLILSVTYCFHTLLCCLQISLASEFCSKSGPLSWALWGQLEPAGCWWFQIYDYIWRRCEWNSLSFFYYKSNTYQLTLYVWIFFVVTYQAMYFLLTLLSLQIKHEISFKKINITGLNLFSVKSC